ncbi:MAG: multidrug DMT transporter permease [Bacteroidota bacterium]|nr:multidrug DMT transporter permease [Bacteroidota bacterium]
MFIVESYSFAVVLCFITMLCWGSWANTQKLASKEWKFQLFYWDYAIGVLLLAIILAFTLGSNGEHGRSFMPDLFQGTSSSFWSAFIGGVLFNLSNILLVIAIDVAGMAVAFPVGVGLALVLGVITNYIAAPIGNPMLLFVGVGAVVIAIILDALAYKKLALQGEKTSGKGIIFSVLAGILMGFFYRFVAASMSSDPVNLELGKYSPYTAVVVFSFGIFLSNFLWNSIAMMKPVEGDPVPFKDYFKKGSPRLHAIGILGGIIWSIGMSLNILASGSAGFAISYGLGQGATMVAAFWGVVIWKEFKNVWKETKNLILPMFLLFILGIALIIISRMN